MDHPGRSFPIPQNPAFFEIRSPDVWGDFGPILMGGFSAERDGHGALLLKRTGPFAPPISMACGYELVITDEFRRILEESPLTGLAFRPIIKHHIAEFHWEQWDRNGEMGDVPPDLNEPEDIILTFPHSEQASQAMGPLWEAWAEPLVDVEIVNERHVSPWRTRYDLLIVDPPPARLDFFRSKNKNWVFASARAKKWLQDNAPHWLRFEPVISSSGPK